MREVTNAEFNRVVKKLTSIYVHPEGIAYHTDDSETPIGVALYCRGGMTYWLTRR